MINGMMESKYLSEALEAGQGDGVKVAVLDSGIDAGHPCLKGMVHESWVVEKDFDKRSCVKKDSEDTIGHGTMCAGVIHQVAPGAELYNVKVVENGRGNIPYEVIVGIEWAIEHQMDIINLSLVMPYMTGHTANAFNKVLERAYYAGVIVVASAESAQTSGFPAESSSVVGVCAGEFDNWKQFSFNGAHSTEVCARGVNVEVAVPGGMFMRTTCNSIAAPHISGVLARIKSAIPDIKPFNVKTVLEILSQSYS